MRTDKNLLFVFIFSALTVSTTFAFATGPESMKDGEVVLGSGIATSCNKGFTIENIGRNEAEIRVIVGDGSYSDADTIEPKGKIAYSLMPTSRTAGTVEARIMNATTGNSVLKVRCGVVTSR